MMCYDVSTFANVSEKIVKKHETFSSSSTTSQYINIVYKVETGHNIEELHGLNEPSDCNKYCYVVFVWVDFWICSDFIIFV